MKIIPLFGGLAFVVSGCAFFDDDFRSELVSCQKARMHLAALSTHDLQMVAGCVANDKATGAEHARPSVHVNTSDFSANALHSRPNLGAPAVNPPLPVHLINLRDTWFR